MDAFRFAEPGWIHLLWLVLLLGGILVWLEFRGRSALDRFLSSVMQSRLVAATSRGRRLTALASLLLALIVMVLAIMRPQWGATTRNLPQVGAQIMVCLDVSKSMLAEDTVPNRLERAKAEIGDLLGLMQGEQVGLIAFAGKATVVSPMTSDFGFLKLMMGNIGPYTVGLGGTRLEEPIRMAVDGFGEAADISRVILLITDGEDHDSFPLQAAEEARERGIKIITIGFGDEVGSKIQITDARGRRRFVTDRDGEPVISRLDGDMLRDIALKTEGAYIPAGTGALDLRSIHAQHIVPLMRGTLESSQQVIRNEAFQWFVLAGLLLLLLSIVIGSGGAKLPAAMSAPTMGTTAQAAVMLIAVAFCVSTATAQSAAPPASETAAPSAQSAAESVIEAVNDGRLATEDPTSDDGAVLSTDQPAASPAEPDPAAEDRDARETYNESLALMSADEDTAEKLLQLARRNAGTDGEVRYRSAYNLGWVQVNRADDLLAEDPKQALVHLQSAADWFRQATSIRPRNTEARYNLEIVLRRALELSDALASKNKGDVAAQLDQLIEQQRETIAGAGQLVERLAATGAAPPDADIYRRDFRELATLERQILSDSQRLTQQVADELDSIANTKEEELKQEQRVRGSQLQGVANYLARGTQRIGQARSQLRRRDDQRAFRRATRGLDELKRARDMLRPPNEILKRLVTDTKSLYAQTKVMADTSDEDAKQGKRRPQWLTTELLDESQQSLVERAAELNAQFEATFGEDAATAEMSDEQQRQFETLKQAPEIMQAAVAAMQDAQTAITELDYHRANDHQTAAYRKLNQALELFLDLKGLVETSHTTQRQVEKLLENMPKLPERQQAAVRKVATQMQQQNIERSERIEREIESQREALGNEAAGPQPPQPQATTQNPEELNAQQKAQERARLQTAADLLRAAKEKMENVQRKLDETTAEGASNETDQSTTDPDVSDQPDDDSSNENDAESSETVETEASETVETVETEDQQDDDPAEPSQDTTSEPDNVAKDAADATERLQELRRLFFSVVEHLEETHQKQDNLNDQTQELAGTPDAEQQQQKMGPLENEQRQLQSMSEQIAEELRNQATQAPPETGDGGISPEQQQQQQQAAEKMAEASKLVREAARSMQQARLAMRDESIELEKVREPQNEAADQLKKALDLLQPPQDRNNNQDQQQQQQNQQNEQEQQPDQQDQQQDPNQGQQKPEQNMSMAELLQMIRDRDAERRRDKEQRRAVRGLPVDKDW